jgi:hypothetical protein
VGFKLALLVLFLLVMGLVLRSLVKKERKTPVMAGHIVLGHLLAFLFGIIISPQLFSLIDPAAIKGVQPILQLAFGWVGFLFGFQFNLQTLRQVQKGKLTRSIIESSTTFIIVAVPVFFGLTFFVRSLDFPPGEVFKTALALGATLSISSPTLLGVINSQIRARSYFVTLLTVNTSIDGLIGVLALGLVNVLWHPYGLGILISVILMLMLGVGQALLLWLLLRSEHKAIPTTILGIGVLTLGAGMSAYLGLSPVVPGALAGMIAANLTPGLRQRLARMLVTAESGLYLGLIVLSGVFIPDIGGAFGNKLLLFSMISGIIGLRILGKSAGTLIIFNTAGITGPRGARGLFACSLQAAGALTLVVALCYQQVIGGKMASLVVFAALGSFLFGEICSVIATPRFLALFRK